MSPPIEPTDHDDEGQDERIPVPRSSSALPGPGRFSRAMRSMFHRVMFAVLGLMGPMVTCRELTEFLARYVEDDLTPEERKAFDRHLAMCRPCRDYVASYQRTIELEGDAFADLDGPVPEDVPEELVQGILAARRAAG